LRRIAALADIHGNLPALEAILAEVEREDPSLVVQA
jgi:predicted phosphodiesterase